MAYTPLTSTEIEVGKATKKELFTKIQNNEDDFNTRIGNLEGSAAKVIVFNEPVLNSTPADTLTNFVWYRAEFAFSLIDAKVIAGEIGGRTGDLEMDVLISPTRDPSSGVSVFTTKPSIDYGLASDYDESSNAVFDTNNKVVDTG